MEPFKRRSIRDAAREGVKPKTINPPPETPELGIRQEAKTPALPTDSPKVPARKIVAPVACEKCVRRAAADYREQQQREAAKERKKNRPGKRRQAVNEAVARLPGGRLPGGAMYGGVIYDAIREMWTGTLSVPTGAGFLTFHAECSAVHHLLDLLCKQYVATLPPAPVNVMEKDT